MNDHGSPSLQPRFSPLPRNGGTDFPSESLLRDSVFLAAALSGTVAALVLQDETGIWYRESSGLGSEQLADLQQCLAQGIDGGTGRLGSQEQGLQVFESLPLVDEHQRVLGALCLLSSTPAELSETQRGGMRLLADHIQAIVAIDQQRIESRLTPRPPSAASFVPGLVHELGSFLFGISANLDAFEARFAAMEEVSKYGANIRRTLDRMSAFITELRDYGNPQQSSWSVLAMEPLLQEAVSKALPLAEKKNLELRLVVDGPLPHIRGDGEGLLATFFRLTELVLQHADPTGCVILHVAARSQGRRSVGIGHFDFPSRKFNEVDPVRLFEPFYFRVSGLGRLTLPVARRVFESHGGTLTAAPGPDGGMRITFMLPSKENLCNGTGDQP